MKTQIISLLLLLSSTVGFAQSNQNIYEIKSGHIEYQLTGNTVGTKSHWWDDYGAKQYTLEKSNTTIKMFGIKDVQEHHSLKIQKGTDIYSIDYITDKAVKSSIKNQMEMASFMQGGYSDAEKEEIRDETLHSLGGDIVGTETIQGRKCEIMELSASKIWFYKQVPLKSETSALGVTNNEIAGSFEENINIPASKFEPPTNVDFQEFEENNMWSGMDDIDEDIEPLPISLDQFCQAINKANSVISINNCKEISGIYTAMGMSKGQMIIISPGHISNMTQAKTAGEMPEDAEFFSINGHEAVYASRFYDEETGEYMDMPVLMVKFPSKAVFITIATPGNLSKADLVNIAKKIHF